MCLILHKPKGETFDKQKMLNCFERNKDGFGWMYYDPGLGKIVSDKTLDMDAEQCAEFVNSLKNYEGVFHWRFKTHGAVTKENCHPFTVTERSKGHGVDMYMMHNGVISTKGLPDEVEGWEKPSDTVIFLEHVVKPILEVKPTLIRKPAFQFLLDDYIGHSKLAFMFGKGEVVRVNEKAGTSFGECWCSNNSYFSPPYTPSANKTLTYGGYTRNHSGWANNTVNKSNTQLPVVDTFRVEYQNKYKLKEGDLVTVFKKGDNNFSTTGRLKVAAHSQGYRAEVKFTNTQGVEVTHEFYAYSGLTVNSGMLNPYFFIPSNNSIPAVDMKKTIAEILSLNKPELNKTVDAEFVEKEVCKNEASVTLKKSLEKPLPEKKTSQEKETVTQEEEDYEDQAMDFLQDWFLTYGYGSQQITLDEVADMDLKVLTEKVQQDPKVFAQMLLDSAQSLLSCIEDYYYGDNTFDEEEREDKSKDTQTDSGYDDYADNYYDTYDWKDNYSYNYANNNRGRD